MTDLHILIVSLIQGLTEFLPVSSSGHLAVLNDVSPFPDQGAIIDVAAHVGTLAAVMVYFYRDVWALFLGLLFTLAGRFSRPEAVLLRRLVVATLPLAAAGFALYSLDLHKENSPLRDIRVVAWTTLIFGILLYVSDRVSPNKGQMSDVGGWSALWVGVSQACALVPGVSRSGVTMTAGRFLGLERTEAARFAMLLSIPAILAAGGLSAYDVYESGDLALGRDALAVAGLSCVLALIAIWGMMALLRRVNMTIFVLYRLALAGVLFWVAYS